MMRTVRRAAWALVLASLPLVGACATGSGGGTGEAVTIQVNNDLVPGSALSIYVLPEVGARRLIGNVDPSTTARLRIDNAVTGRVRLMARTTGGNEIVSDPILASDGDVLEWNLSSNIVRLIEGSG